MKRSWLLVPLLLASGLVLADEVKKEEPKQEPKQEGPKRLEGISILGNQDAPKSLVIVPWKTSELGGMLGISPLLDDSRLPVDREVFLRALSYYEIRSGDATQHAAAAPGRKS